MRAAVSQQTSSRCGKWRSFVLSLGAWRSLGTDGGRVDWTRSSRLVGQRRGDMYGNLTLLALSENKLKNKIHARPRGIWIESRAAVQRQEGRKTAATRLSL